MDKGEREYEEKFDVFYYNCSNDVFVYVWLR